MSKDNRKYKSCTAQIGEYCSKHGVVHRGENKPPNLVEVFIGGQKVWESQSLDEINHVEVRMNGVRLSYEK